MLRKCIHCDGKGEKTIETKTDDYLKIGNGYAHTNCHLIKLTTRKQKRMVTEDAIVEIERIKSIMRAETDLGQIKDDFFQLIMDYYNVSLGRYFYQRIAEVTNGTREGLLEPISYHELYEMYDNDKMMRKLDKIAHKKNMKDNSKRLFWDLAIMVGEYENYKKSKVSKLHDDENVKKIIDDAKRLKHVVTKKETENKESDDVDVMDLVF